MSKNTKILRDPIYNLISFNKETDKVIIDLLNTKEVQRLKRIRQLGLSWYTYPSSVHDRFAHSLGVCFLAGKMFESLRGIPTKIEVEKGNSIAKDELKTIVQIAALLHDIGHGPFSHAFEKVTAIDHEKFSIHVLTSENSDINSCLRSYFGRNAKQRIQWIREILDKTFPVVWVRDIVSSQLDADRMDYLLRDAYMCGVQYVRFDWEWILNSMVLSELKSQERKAICFEATRGVHSLEAFIVSRYHMYEQVYFHKTTRGAEKLIGKIFQRVKELMADGKESRLGFCADSVMGFFKTVGRLNTKNEGNIIGDAMDDFLTLDDFLVLSHINIWQRVSKDLILKSLCRSLMHREFKMIKESGETHVFGKQQYEKLRKVFSNKEKEEYFYFEDDYIDNPYKDSYLLGKEHPEDAGQIWLLYDNGDQRELANQSSIVQSLRNKEFRKSRAYTITKYSEKIRKELQR